MAYKVVITADAKNDLDQFIHYLILDQKNTQAARNVLNDFDATIESLSYVANSLKLCDNPRLRQLKYHRINFLNQKWREPPLFNSPPDPQTPFPVSPSEISLRFRWIGS